MRLVALVRAPARPAGTALATGGLKMTHTADAVDVLAHILWQAVVEGLLP